MRHITRSFLARLVASVFVLALLPLGTSSCKPRPSDADIPSVTAPPQTTGSSPTSSYPPPRLPTAPSCRLLTREEVRAAFGGGEVQDGFGSRGRFTGAAGFPLDIDMCSWQQHAGGNPGRVVQVSIHTAASQAEAEAVKEYEAFLEQAIENTAPTATTTLVPGLGTRAARIPQWLVAQRQSTVLAVTMSPAAQDQPPDPAVLERLAMIAARRLGW